MTDYKQLCGELLDMYDLEWRARERIKAALAESEPEGPTGEELLSLEQLRDTWNAQADAANSWDELGVDEIIWWAQRQALARWGHPAPQPATEDSSAVQPADGEVTELATAEMARQLRTKAATEKANRCHYSAKLLTRAADLLERQHPQPVPVSERLPGHIEQALIKAECALSDIAEGEAEESEGDPLEWAEKRAADALARIRPVMRQHQIQTSEWPPIATKALPLPQPH